jgi:phosphate transport system substrate-binding protein
MKRRYITLAVILTTSLLFLGCIQSGTSENKGAQPEKAEKAESRLSGEVRVAGSSTVYLISTAMAEEFSKLYPDVIVSVQSTGTGGGFKNFFIVGKTDINGASRPIKQSELDAAKENGVEPLEFTVAYDGLSVIVNPEANWVDCMSIEHLREIWKPDTIVKKWSDIDESWPEKEIRLYGPTSASGTFDFFTKVVVGEERASRSDYHGTEEDNTIIQAVARDKYAMGYLGMAYYLENKDMIKAIKIKNPEGVCTEPSIESVKSGEYRPLARPLFIYVNKESLKDAAVREFVRFYLENLDSEIIEEIGYVSVSKETKEENLKEFNDALKELGGSVKSSKLISRG